MSRLSGDISDNIAYKIIQMTIMIPAVAILFCITLLSAAAIVYSFWRFGVKHYAGASA